MDLEKRIDVNIVTDSWMTVCNNNIYTGYRFYNQWRTGPGGGGMPTGPLPTLKSLAYDIIYEIKIVFGYLSNIVEYTIKFLSILLLYLFFIHIINK